MYNYYRTFATIADVREYDAHWASVFEDMANRGLNELHGAIPGFYFRVVDSEYQIMATA